MKKMTEEEESNFSDGKKLATDYYHCLQNSPEEMYKFYAENSIYHHDKMPNGGEIFCFIDARQDIKENYKLLNFENAKFKILHIKEATKSEYLMKILNIESENPLHYIFGITTLNETTKCKFIQCFEMMQKEDNERSYVKFSKFMYKDWKLDSVDESGESIIRKVRDQKSLGEMVDEFNDGRMSHGEIDFKLEALVEVNDAEEKENDEQPGTGAVRQPERVNAQVKYSSMLGDIPEDIKEVLNNENQEIENFVHQINNEAKKSVADNNDQTTANSVNSSDSCAAYEDAQKIFIGQLSHGAATELSKRQIKVHFEKYGRVLHVEIIPSKDASKPNFGWVAFEDTNTVDSVMEIRGHACKILHETVSIHRYKNVYKLQRGSFRGRGGNFRGGRGRGNMIVSPMSPYHRPPMHPGYGPPIIFSPYNGPPTFYGPPMIRGYGPPMRPGPPINRPIHQPQMTRFNQPNMYRGNGRRGNGRGRNQNNNNRRNDKPQTFRFNTPRFNRGNGRRGNGRGTNENNSRKY